MDEAEKRRVIRDAATIVLLRKRDGRDQVLMGQRGAGAVFMPNKYVFPGGAVDPQDYDIPLGAPLATLDAERLSVGCDKQRANALAVAAVRELWEETGLMLGTPSDGLLGGLGDWDRFASKGLAPNGNALRFVFRAITPPGRTRRFDARFFIADSAAVAGSDEDFADASDELGHLHWIDLAEAKALDLPFITEVVLSEVIAIQNGPSAERKVPFFHHDEVRSHFSML